MDGIAPAARRTDARAASQTSVERIDPDATTLARDPSAWDAFVVRAVNGSFPQLAAWGTANRAKGWRVHRVVAGAGSGPIGAQVLAHVIGPGPWSRGYAPRGPVAEAFDAAGISAFTRAARLAARRLRLSHLVVDPELAAGHPVEGWLEAEGWRQVGRVLINRTRIIDLGRAEDELWAGLRSSARWSVGKARRSGFTVVDTDAAGLDDFERLYLETARRVGFQPAAFRAVFEAFAAAGDARLLVACGPDGAAAAAHMLIPCGDRAIEFYGASTEAGSRARANYLVKWEAIRSSRERGYARYDMWGTDRDTPGLSEFKAGFGGTEIEYVGAWELITDRRARRVVDAVRRVRTIPSSVRTSVRRRTGS